MAKTLCFNLINSVAELSQLHRISDAGAGQGAMQYTPARDTELLAYGQILTQLPPLPSSSEHLSRAQQQFLAQGLLGSGGITPAVLVHGLLRLFSEAGYAIQIRSFNFSDAPVPQTQTQTQTQASSQDWLIEHYSAAELGQSGLLQLLLDSLQTQAASGVLSLLAECGVGGTTLATLWLRGLTGLALTPAGSTNAPDKLKAKVLLLQQLQQQHLSQPFALSYMLSQPDAHDALQLALCYLAQNWSAELPFPLLAGGVMMLAPLLACQQTGWFEGDCRIATTRWVLDAGCESLLAQLPDNYQLLTHQSRFWHSLHPCLHRYEQGQVVEGCGLGGMLVLAEQHGFSQPQIIAALDAAVAAYLQHRRYE